MAAGNLHNYGGSDEATEMIIATAYDALYYDIGFDYDPASLGKGCPSQRTIAQAWAGVNFEPVLKGVCQDIVIHTMHQQRCENFVQMAALITKTLVGEARGTWRAIVVSTTIRQFNLWAIETRRKVGPNQVKRDKMKRVEGHHCIDLFIIFLRDFIKKVQRERG